MNQSENEVNEQLKQLALIAQHYPPLTQGRQLALKQLVQTILNWTAAISARSHCSQSRSSADCWFH